MEKKVTNTKQQWKEQAKRMFGYCISSLLPKTDSKSVRLTVSVSELPEEYQRSSCSVPTYKKEQRYIFYIDLNNAADIKSNITNIYVFQEEMSRENAHACVQIDLHTPCNICELNDNKMSSIKDSLVSFLLANIVWK